jgi:GAF domain-containing protein
MSAVSQNGPPSQDEFESLRRENEALLRELENTYAQLAAVLQVSQDETRIAYSELQDKLVVQEKKLVELAFMDGAQEALLEERDVDALRRLTLDKICLIVPVDLAVLALLPDLSRCLQRERDVVREVAADRARQDALAALVRRVEPGGRAVWLVADFEADPSAALLRLRPDARSAACLALRARGRLFGVLILNARLRANFRDDQETLLGSFAHQVAAALAHAQETARHRATIAALLKRHQLGVPALEACLRAVDRDGAPGDPRLLSTVGELLGRTERAAPTPSPSEVR